MTHPFFNLYSTASRVAVGVPECRVADPAYNADQTLELARQAAQGGAALVAFPELGLSSYTCDDLFHQPCAAARVRTGAPAHRGGLGVAAGRAGRRHAAGGGASAVQLRRGGGQRRHPGRGAEELPAELLGILRGAPVQRGGLRTHRGPHLAARRHGAVRRGPAVRDREHPVLPFPCGNLRGRLGAGAAVVVRGAGRGHGAGEPVGVEYRHRQVRLPAPTGVAAVGALPGGLPVHLRPARESPPPTWLGWPGADLRERRTVSANRSGFRTVRTC